MNALFRRLPRPIQKIAQRLSLAIRLPLYRLQVRIVNWRRAPRPGPFSDWASVDLSSGSGHRLEAFCLSLLTNPRCDYRRQHFQKLARRQGWKVDFWPSVDGRLMKERPPWLGAGVRANGTALTSGEIGLLASTRALYLYGRDQGLDYLLVFEDDAYINAAPQVMLPADFDVAFLNDRIVSDGEGQVRGGCGTYSYLVSRRGIEKLLALLEQPDEPIDLLILRHTRTLIERGHFLTLGRDHSKPQLECCHLGPMVAHVNYFDSTIGARILEREN